MTGLVGGAVAVLAAAAIFVLERRRRVERSFTLYSSAGRWAEALPYARALAARRAPLEVRGRRQVNLATLLARLERWDEARRAFSEALETQRAAGDTTAALTRFTLGLLELRDGRAEAARGQAAAIEAEGPDDLRGRALVLRAAAAMIEKKPSEALAMLEPRGAELAASKRPGDMVALAVLAWARGGDPELVGLVRERMAAAQRRELASQLPALAPFLAPP